MNATAYTLGEIILDRYRIERCLPQGGFSQNYVAIDTQSQQRVAIKQFFGEAIDEQYRDLAKRMFREEADMLRKFGAPNSQIPAWLSYVDERDSEPVIVQEFIEGETYEQRVTKDCVLGEPAAIEFLREILPPIAALHEAGFCHRDISPENIIRSSQHHKPVLIDFGFSAQYRCRAEVRDRLRVAKRGYTAPEQQERGEFSPQSDFFSLGCTLIFLLTGRDPDTFSRDAQGHLNWKGELESSNRLVSLIDQMVALNPHDRPGSSQAIVQTLATLHEAPPDMSIPPTEILGDGAAKPPSERTTIYPEAQADLDPQPLPPRQPPKPPFNPVVLLVAASLAVVVGLVTVGIVQRFQDTTRTDPQPPVIDVETEVLKPPTLPEDGLTPETPAPTVTPTAIATPTPKPSTTPTPTSAPAPTNSAPSPVEAAPASNPAPVYAPEPAYEPEPYYAPEPAYEPEPYYAPEPAYEPEPYYAPEPVYVAPEPAPAPPASSLPSCADVAWGACQ